MLMQIAGAEIVRFGKVGASETDVQPDFWVNWAGLEIELPGLWIPEGTLEFNVSLK